ncbi:MAG: DUF1385 domain-containing protein [Lachnospiraceae bacterium]|nr:DUF1385 domain-containing protein [Lachnospiraceae bacterium]
MSRKKKKVFSGIGGQAVLEGVMMKNKDKYAVAVRKPDGDIAVDVEAFTGVGSDLFISKIPFIRGVFNFINSLVLGMKTLTYSASFYEEEDKKDTETDKEMEKIAKGKQEGILMGATTVFAVLLAVGLFVILPFFVSNLISKYVRNESLMAIIEGLLRIVIFLGYVIAISSMKDIRRLYQYHGAEHKCINCIEHGHNLNVHNVKKSSRLHKRCGTSFIVFILFISIILFFFIRTDNMLLKVVYRLLLIPVIAGISYEAIRLAGKSDNVIMNILSAPGLLFQKITTKEPDEDMIEVAIQSVEAVFDWRGFIADNFEVVEEEPSEEVYEETYEETGAVYEEEYDEEAKESTEEP